MSLHCNFHLYIDGGTSRNGSCSANNITHVIFEDCQRKTRLSSQHSVSFPLKILSTALCLHLLQTTQDKGNKSNPSQHINLKRLFVEFSTRLCASCLTQALPSQPIRYGRLGLHVGAGIIAHVCSISCSH